jgi:hypothetical protein
VVPVKPVLQAQKQLAGAPLTEFALPLHRTPLLHIVHVG